MVFTREVTFFTCVKCQLVPLVPVRVTIRLGLFKALSKEISLPAELARRCSIHVYRSALVQVNEVLELPKVFV